MSTDLTFFTNEPNQTLLDRFEVSPFKNKFGGRTMNFRRTLLVVILLLIPIHSFAGSGDLQVTCEPNVRIFIDGNLKGVTNEYDNGLFIEGLTPGRHTLKAVKSKYMPVVETVMIKEYKAVEVKINFKEFREEVIELKPEVKETIAKVGILELRSVPMGATVFVDGEKKPGSTDMQITNVKIGKHKIDFQRENQNLVGIFNLNENETLKLKAHFKKGKIINISEIEKFETERNNYFNRLLIREKGILKGGEGVDMWNRFLSKYPDYSPAKDKLSYWNKLKGKIRYEHDWLTDEEIAQRQIEERERLEAEERDRELRAKHDRDNLIFHAGDYMFTMGNNYKQMNYYDALRYCNNLSLGGYSKWSMPKGIQMEEFRKKYFYHNKLNSQLKDSFKSKSFWFGDPTVCSDGDWCALIQSYATSMYQSISDKFGALCYR